MASGTEPRAALVIIGAEVLSGKIADENAPFLVHELRARGVEVVEIRTIGDDVETIAAAVRALAAEADHVLTTGGVGPTHDDVTIAGVARAFDVAVVRDPEIERRLVARYRERLKPAHLKMAEVPAGARLTFLDDTAFLSVVQARNVTVLPGVPFLARLCFARVADEFHGVPFFGRTLWLAASESSFAAELARVQERFPRVAIGSYPRFEKGTPGSRMHRVKITLDGRDPALVDEALAAVRAGLEPAWILGESPDAEP